MKLDNKTTNLRVLFTAMFQSKRYLVLILIALVAFGAPSCKSKKKVTDNKVEKPKVDQRVVNAKNTLNNLLSDDSKSVEELEKELQNVKAMNLNDPEVQQLIKKLEEKIAKKKEAKKEEKKKEYSLAEYFDMIANAPSTDVANQRINEAMKLCANGSVPVLIIIWREGTDVDYDEPTTIDKYLNYLKDVKKNPNKIENLKFDANKKITEVELIKK